MKIKSTAWAVLGLLIAAGCAKKEAPAVASAQPQEIHWITNIDSALVIAAEKNKPVMVDFMATWCPPCRMMEDSTFSRASVIEKAGEFITVRIDVDKQGPVADAWNANAGKYGGIGIPNMLFLDKDKNRLVHKIGFMTAEELTGVMDSVLTAEGRP